MKKLLFIFRIRNWQLFIVLILPLVVSILCSSLKIELGNYGTTKIIAVIRIVGTIVFFSWLLILGLSLNRLKDNPYRFNDSVFVLSILFSTFTYFDLNLVVLLEEQHYLSIPVKGLIALLSLMGLINIFHKIPKSLKSYELKTIAPYSKCLLDLLLILTSAIGIGVWFLQPRLNNIEKLK